MTARNTPRKAPTKKAAPKAPIEVVEGRFARLRREAAEQRQRERGDAKGIEPYIIDDVSPPIVIEAPSTNEQFITLFELMQAEGGLEVRQIRGMLGAFCGPAWPRVWSEILKDGDEFDFTVFLDDLIAHFEGVAGVGAEHVPGKSPA